MGSAMADGREGRVRAGFDPISERVSSPSINVTYQGQKGRIALVPVREPKAILASATNDGCNETMIYRPHDPLPWAALASPLAAPKTPSPASMSALPAAPSARAGAPALTSPTPAPASPSRRDLVLLEDLVLHDAGRDRHAPSQELARAHAVLRIRRRIAAAACGWATSSAGLAALSEDPDGAGDQGASLVRAVAPVEAAEQEGDFEDVDDALAAEIAGIDALIARSNRLLTDSGVARAKSPLVYDRPGARPNRSAPWRQVIADSRTLPPVLARAVAVDAWVALEPHQHAAGSARCSRLISYASATKPATTFQPLPPPFADCHATAGSCAIPQPAGWPSSAPSPQVPSRDCGITHAGCGAGGTAVQGSGKEGNSKLPSSSNSCSPGLSSPRHHRGRTGITRGAAQNLVV